jgi:hypothetical protein
MLFDFTHAELASGRKGIAALLEMLGGDIAPHPGLERRAATRQRTAVPISLIPVDDQLNPTDEGFRGIVRDISAVGLSYLHHRDVPTRYLIVQFVLPKLGTLKIPIEVVRTENWDPLYITAATFVTSEEPPAAKRARTRASDKRSAR